MNAWVYLTLAGIAEIGYTTSMKLSNNFTNIKYSLVFVICTATSFLLLNKSLSGIPLGTAYAVWTGIGAFGTAIIGMIFFKDPASITRIILLTILIASIVGLKVIPS